MDLTVRDLMRLFQVTEKTITRWIKEKDLPVHKLNNQYHCNRAALLEWAHEHGIRLRPSWIDEGETPSGVSLLNAVREGGVLCHVPGTTKEEAYGHLARLAKLPPSLAADELKELLLAREALSSTGVGQGVAIPHVRDPIILPIEKPAVSICFLDHPVDLGASDDQPIHTFFLLLSSTTREHLRLLSRIAYVLNDPVFLKMLVAREPQERLLAQISVLEGAVKDE